MSIWPRPSAPSTAASRSPFDRRRTNLSRDRVLSQGICDSEDREFKLVPGEDSNLDCNPTLSKEFFESAQPLCPQLCPHNRLARQFCLRFNSLRKPAL